MKNPLSFAPLLLTLLAAPHMALAGTCEEQAAERKLAGAAKTSFLKKCHADAGGGPSACKAQADAKKLHGAAATSFIKKCEASRAPAADKPGEACLAQAEEKKLHGAARNSFVKKCQKDAAASAP
ncbi:hypothetical protein [Inhella gelatinilytica]|uniref:PsiF repeat-containing protein n=1 Tax=Inhella gelatinilytica TaxID=2795030 RepID=A0A931IRZ3_9BURK|nr:hypothetical protein [Inhella gelatinilytica]MBH9551590.1 hypothetical protein [Inhella gelatinilytica]